MRPSSRLQPRAAVPSWVIFALVSVISRGAKGLSIFFCRCVTAATQASSAAVIGVAVGDAELVTRPLAAVDGAL